MFSKNWHFILYAATILIIGATYSYWPRNSLVDEMTPKNEHSISFAKIMEIQAGDIVVLDSGRGVIALQNYHGGMVAFGKIGVGTFSSDLSTPSQDMAIRITKIIKPGTHEYVIAFLGMVEDSVREDRIDNVAILPFCRQGGPNPEYCTWTSSK